MFTPWCEWGTKKHASGKLLFNADKSGYKASDYKEGSASPLKNFELFTGKS